MLIWTRKELYFQRAESDSNSHAPSFSTVFSQPPPPPPPPPVSLRRLRVFQLILSNNLLLLTAFSSWETSFSPMALNSTYIWAAFLSSVLSPELQAHLSNPYMTSLGYLAGISNLTCPKQNS